MKRQVPGIERSYEEEKEWWEDVKEEEKEPKESAGTGESKTEIPEKKEVK